MGFLTAEHAGVWARVGLQPACSYKSVWPLAHPAGLIGTGVYVPAADPSSPRITQPAGTAPGAGPPAPTASPFGLPGAPSGTATCAPGVAQQPQQPTHARSDTVVVRPASKGGEAAAAAPVQAVPTQAPQYPPGSPPAGRSSDYLAALDRQGRAFWCACCLRQAQMLASAKPCC